MLYSFHSRPTARESMEKIDEAIKEKDDPFNTLDLIDLIVNWQTEVMQAVHAAAAQSDKLQGVELQSTVVVKSSKCTQRPTLEALKVSYM